MAIIADMIAKSISKSYKGPSASEFKSFDTRNEELGIDLERLRSDLTTDEVRDQDDVFRCLQLMEDSNMDCEAESRIIRNNRAGAECPAKADQSLSYGAYTQYEAEENVYSMEN